MADRPDDLAITMHICRGNFRSTWAASGGYDAVAETILDGLNLDGLFLEYDDDRSGNFDPLRFVKRKDLQIVLGLITSKYGELENPDDVKRRINEVRVLSAWISCASALSAVLPLQKKAIF